MIGNQATLSCGDTVIFAGSRHTPAVGDTIFCRKCNASTTVIIINQQYRARCQECSYSRSFGQALLTAQTYANIHGTKRNHTVAILQGNNLVELIHQKDTQDVLALEFGT